VEGVRDVQQGIQGAYNGVLEVSFAPLVDVKDPLVVRFDAVRRQANDLDLTLLEIGGTARDFRKFGGAYRSEVIGVRKKDGLAITLVSVDPGNTNKISKLPRSHRSTHGT
jgi:hypothetical protein